MRKGISPLVSTVIMIAISIATITIVLGIGLPAIDRAKESLLLGEARNVLTTLDNAIRTVLFEGAGSARTINLAITSGDYFVFAGNDSIVFDMDQQSGIVERGIYRKEGNFYINTGADVKAYENDYLTDPSLVGYWKLNSANSTNHTADSSIYKNDGKLYKYPCNPATCNFTSGQVSNVLQFDGVDDYVDAGNAASLNITDAITIEAWVKPNVNNNANMVLSKSNSVGTIRPYDVWLGGVYTKFNFAVYDGSWHIVQATIDAVVGEWHHIVGRFDGSSITIFQNGIQGSSSALTALPSNTANLTIGRQGDAMTGYFNGTIDEVKIWNRSLTADEIRQNYYRGLKGRELGTNLVLENSRVIFEVPKIGLPTALATINTSHLVEKITVKETGTNVTPADSAIFINADRNTGAGNGYTQLLDSGSELRRARVKAYIESAAGTIYNIYYTLFSNADFVFIEVKS